jgi:hypothetical protein
MGLPTEPRDSSSVMELSHHSILDTEFHVEIDNEKETARDGNVRSGKQCG